MSLQQAITDFRGQFRGVVVEPTDAAYEEARKVYNAMIDRKPRLIARCTDVADVIADHEKRPSPSAQILSSVDARPAKKENCRPEN